MELEQACARLLEMNRMKSELLSHVSHEQKTPVAAMYGFIILVAKRLSKSVLPALPPGNDKLYHDVQLIQRNMTMLRQDAERLSEIILNVIDLTELEFGNSLLNMEPVAPAEIVQRAGHSGHGSGTHL